MSLEQWETYYRGGALATGPSGEDGGYDLEVRQAWTEFFSTVRDGARILDIGTGNGVVALIAAETARLLGRNWEIHGTDLANINPVRDVADGATRLAGIQFHPGVATEKLGFESASFDAVSGHYALEYAEPESALAEIHRVLKPGSDAQFILHSTDSALVRSAHVSLQESELVFKDTKIFRRLHRLLTIESAPQATIERASLELRMAIASLKQGLEEMRPRGGGLILSVALDSVQKLMQASKGAKPRDIGLEIDRVEEVMRTSLRRLHDLVAHARSEADMKQLEQFAVAAGFTAVEVSAQRHAGVNVVGWQLLLHRP